MSNNDLTVDSIIKKYEQRQDKLVSSLGNKAFDFNNTVRQHEFSLKDIEAGRQTPQFNSIGNHKEKKMSK